MTYTEALQYLYGLRRFGLRPGLETTRSLARRAGNPEDRLRFIHVAGTNGKGSTCAFLESIWRNAGRRVGLHTSPHLLSFRERIQVDQEWIPEQAVARGVAELARWTENLTAEQHPTFFEIITILALRWFQERQCDLVIWETGMGGRLDATNIVTPLASVITSIGLDHTEWLGSNLAAIAREKAGIIKPGVLAVTAVNQPEPLSVIREVAAQVGAPLRQVTESDPEMALARSVRLPLVGAHQQTNAALAAATATALGAPKECLRSGLEQAHWPGRFQVIRHAARTLVLDGAHNAPAFAALAMTLCQEFRDRRYVLILGMLADKDHHSAAELLVPRATKTLIVPVPTSRGGDPEVLVRACATWSQGRPVERMEGLANALAALPPEALAVITGSLYLVGEALALISGDPGNERGLNDWGPTR